jgi:hypothetical protein
VNPRILRLPASLFCLLAALALSAAPTFAAAPLLDSVTVTGGQATVRWSLPRCVESRLIETAVASSTNNFGYFYPQGNVYSFDIPVDPKTDTSVVVDDPLNDKFVAGTYYAHVGGVDTSRQNPPIEFSNVLKVVVDAAGNGTASRPGPRLPQRSCPSGSGGGTGGGGTGGGGTGGGGGRTVVKVTPFGKLSYRRVQAVRKLYVTARSTEAGTLRASATVKVPGRRRAYRFKSVSRKVGANRSVKLRLKLSKKRLRAVRRALRKGKRLRVRVKVTARTVAGAARSQKATIRLKR